VRSYHVQRPGAHGSQPIAAALVVAGVLALWAASAFAFAPTRVTVDGVPRTLPMGTTVAEVAASGVTTATFGDLVSVGGSVATTGGGLPPAVALDGRAAARDARVPDGAVLVSSRGVDVTESVVTTLAATDIPVVEEGDGPTVTLTSLGAPGLAIATIGEVSGELVEGAPLVEASPMVLVRSGPPSGSKLVALTFDDGPWPGQTEAVLEILARERVRATFFMLGLRVQRAPDLARRVVAEGHVVGNHTQSHTLLARAPLARIRYEMATGETVIKRYTGVEPTWFRAPGGSVSPAVKAQAKALGERMAGWGIDPGDWKRPPARFIVQRVVAAARPGAIILLHDGGGDRKQTIDALPAIIGQLKAQGYTFVTLDEMYAPR